MPPTKTKHDEDTTKERHITCQLQDIPHEAAGTRVQAQFNLASALTPMHRLENVTGGKWKLLKWAGEHNRRGLNKNSRVFITMAKYGDKAAEEAARHLDATRVYEENRPKLHRGGSAGVGQRLGQIDLLGLEGCCGDKRPSAVHVGPWDSGEEKMETLHKSAAGCMGIWRVYISATWSRTPTCGLIDLAPDCELCLDTEWYTAMSCPAPAIGYHHFRSIMNPGTAPLCLRSSQTPFSGWPRESWRGPGDWSERSEKRVGLGTVKRVGKYWVNGKGGHNTTEAQGEHILLGPQGKRDNERSRVGEHLTSGGKATFINKLKYRK
ncbi:hypothetical protein B0H16DRAFT_1479509 [Mycena metata]|uniref:Uncharacterized protein n=1 Tax=Mycena metata TaxID=1033252 RepID=A0AAD7H581_9AGAR|nr:hypothetical protein B0H16DRAFT_1479509 [Mycena metata]